MEKVNKFKVMSFMLGIFIGHKGLTIVQHLVYIGLIAAAFYVGTIFV